MLPAAKRLTLILKKKKKKKYSLNERILKEMLSQLCVLRAGKSMERFGRARIIRHIWQKNRILATEYKTKMGGGGQQNIISKFLLQPIRRTMVLL